MDVVVGSYLLDFIGPLLVNPEPAPASVDVDLGESIAFDLIDTGGAGVDLLSVTVTVDGVVVYENGVADAGWSMVVSALMPAGNWHFELTPAAGLPYNDTVDVDVDASDLAPVPNVMATYSWSFETMGVMETPRLAAYDRLVDIVCVWQVNPLMVIDHYELRRSTASFPTSPDLGTLVYSGSAKSFIDVNVIADTRYYYTIFAVLPSSEYVPYDQQASDDAALSLVRVSAPVVREYVPYSGEFGVVSQPWPFGKLVSVWGTNGPDYDTWNLPRGRKIMATVSGVVVSTLPLAVDTDSGVRVTMSGQLTPSVVIGARVVSGRPIADSRGGEVTLKLVKLAVAQFGDRTIRPSYLYLAVDRRR